MYHTQDLTKITDTNIKNLLELFKSKTYAATEDTENIEEILERSKQLMELDYNVSIISNKGGDLCYQYPSKLFIVNSEKNRTSNVFCEPIPEENASGTQNLRNKMHNARLARCRSRFPVPVIYYKGKPICRSATLAGTPEALLSEAYYYFSSIPEELPIPEKPRISKESNKQAIEYYRSRDIELLRSLNVGIIIDLMVEQKKVKYFVNVSSSEKVDKKKRYASFNVIPMPYPGCEFFKDFRNNSYTATKLIFDWSQPHVNAELNVPDEASAFKLNIDWSNYKKWNLELITQNYLKLLLKYVEENKTGVLIHCISGWDRTPLFISLLRILLWADGLLHISLDHLQIIYLTIAYDWYLFAHHLSDRIGKGEDIFFFCFYMLKYLSDDSYSISSKSKRSQQEETINGNANINDDLNGNNAEVHKTVDRSDGEFQFITKTDNCNLSELSHKIVPTKPANLSEGDLQLESELESDANQSHNTSGSSIYEMTDSFFSTSPLLEENHPHPGNGNESDPLVLPILHRRTSPVSVPVSSRIRQRQESTSSIGSWQIITATGSLKGSESASAIDAQSGNCIRNDFIPMFSEFPNLTKQEKSIRDHLLMRKKRLEQVRQSFMTLYSHTVGLRYKEGDYFFGLELLRDKFKIATLFPFSNSLYSIFHSFQRA